jgi:hypothetical protein
MNETNNNRSLWRSSDQQEFFLIGDVGVLPPGSFRILDGEGESLAVAYESLAAFAIDRKDAKTILEESLQAHVESIVRRKKELQLLETETGAQESIDLDRVKAFLQSEEAKRTVRSLAAALRQAADKIERSPADIEKSLGQLFAKFINEITAEEQRTKEKNAEERKKRIGSAVKDSIANALKDINKK